MLRIGSRGSVLAQAQAQWVRRQVLDRFSGLEVTIQIFKTTGDQDAKTSIRSGSARGVFVKEIEEALEAAEIDLAVHSMKDLPTSIPGPLEISTIPIREDPRDALISRNGAQSLETLPSGAVVGTGSVRRQAQILAARPDLKVRDIRGNVDTRLRKLDDGNYDAIILACAGLNRLGMQDRISSRLELNEMLPAPGQGALGLETRKNDKRVFEMIAFLNHRPTATAVLAERAFLRRLKGGCNSPIAVHATLEDEILKIDGFISTPDGSKFVRASITQQVHLAEKAALSLADKILADGGEEILRGPGLTSWAE
jgi:hydroxymethylbilane synthase